MGLDSFISRQFGNPAGMGGKLVSYIMNRQNRPLYEETIRLLPLSGSDSVLDIGCGNGYVLNMLARQHDCAFTGIDISRSIIHAASRRNRSYIKSGKMKLMPRDVNEMPFPDECYSKIYTINTVYFWDNPGKTMLQIRRVLKPGGIFVNALYTSETLSRFSHTKHGYKRFTEEQLVDMGESVGFTVSVAPVLDASAYCVLYKKPDSR